MIHKIYEVDPLVCTKCKGAMRVISSIEDPSVIRDILNHLVIWFVGSRSSLPHTMFCVHYSIDIQDSFSYTPSTEKGVLIKNNWMEMSMSWDSFNKEIGFLRPCWWIIHLVGMATVYILGHLLWR